MIDFYPAGGSFFGVKEYNEATIRCFKERNMNYHFKNNLIAIDTNAKIATFKDKNGNAFDKKYDFIHVTPPMKASSVVENSSLADEKGWANTNKFTLQHKRYPNVFCLGDSSNLPTSKTGAGIREQYKVLGENLIQTIAQKRT